MSRTYEHYERRFLNKEHGRAYSIMSIQAPRSDDHVSVDAELGDCMNNIYLEFGFSRKVKGDKEKQLAKLDALIKSFQKLRKVMNDQR